MGNLKLRERERKRQMMENQRKSEKSIKSIIRMTVLGSRFTWSVTVLLRLILPSLVVSVLRVSSLFRAVLSDVVLVVVLLVRAVFLKIQKFGKFEAFWAIFSLFWAELKNFRGVWKFRKKKHCWHFFEFWKKLQYSRN